MYKVKVSSSFSGAHNLRGYKGKCEELHGHNWRVELMASSERTGELGMVVDFKDLKSALDEALSGMDHKYLNDLGSFEKMNPTSENIARFIFDEVSRKNPDLGIEEVSVWETDSSCATYSRGS